MNSSTSCAKDHDTLALDAADVVEVFNALFAVTEATRLCGGAAEPLYVPAGPRSELAPATIHFRHDYLASALHEVAHWCIAGPARRAQRDFGYWYAPDGRTRAQQARFFEVETQPQALEWCFSQAAGSAFHLSVDNLDGHTGAADHQDFAIAVAQAVRRYCEEGLPERASLFFDALRTRYRPALRLAELPVIAEQQLL